MCLLELELFAAVQTFWYRLVMPRINALIAKRQLAVVTLPPAVRRGMMSAITHEVVLDVKGSPNIHYFSRCLPGHCQAR